MDPGQLAFLLKAIQEQPTAVEDQAEIEGKSSEDPATAAEIEEAEKDGSAGGERAGKEGTGWTTAFVERRQHRAQVPAARRQCKACKPTPQALSEEQATWQHPGGAAR